MKLLTSFSFSHYGMKQKSHGQTFLNLFDSDLSKSKRITTLQKERVIISNQNCVLVYY